MLSYAQRRCFSTLQLGALAEAQRLVSIASNSWGDELRCHELARAVQLAMKFSRPELVVVDGKMLAVEHSWLVWDSRKSAPGTLDWLRRNGEVQCHASSHGAILDVYVPGRMPQVQLVDPFLSMYRIGEPRTDIREHIIARLLREMDVPDGTPRPF